MHSPRDTTTDGPRHSHAQVGMEGVTALIRPVFSLLDPVYWIPPPPLQLLPIATMLLCVFIAARQGTVRREGPRMDRWAWTVREAGRLRDSPSALGSFIRLPAAFGALPPARNDTRALQPTGLRSPGTFPIPNSAPPSKPVFISRLIL